MRARLEPSIRFASGIPNFEIFLDRKDIGWGEKWAERIVASLDEPTLLFGVVTPRNFTHPPCREDLMKFQHCQAALGRNDLILPICYNEADQMKKADAAAADEREAAALLRASQFEDWRSLRNTLKTDPAYRDAVERMAKRAKEALKRGNEDEAKRAGLESETP